MSGVLERQAFLVWMFPCLSIHAEVQGKILPHCLQVHCLGFVFGGVSSLVSLVFCSGFVIWWSWYWPGGWLSFFPMIVGFSWW